jgi:hypothetical protein
MITRIEHKNLSFSRLKSAKILLDGKDWDMAGYLMGYVLECALKAAVCRNLKLNNYPDNIVTDDQARSFFSTHRIDRLLIISGMSDIFMVTTTHPKILQNWSDFTFNYPSNWTEQRYRTGYWDEQKVKNCYTNLTEKPYGILHQFIKYRRW